jgi:hypothetical protein
VIPGRFVFSAHNHFYPAHPGSRSPKEGIAIRYHVIFRTAGEETMTHVEAADAATAVAAVQCVQQQDDIACELLSVVVDDNRESE